VVGRLLLGCEDVGVYAERPSRIAGAYAWTSTVDEADTRVLPDGCIDLIWIDGDMYVAGPDTQARMFSGRPGSRLAGIRFAPGHGPLVVGVPACELTDQLVPVDALWPTDEAARLGDEVGASGDPLAVLERTAIERAGPEMTDDLVTEVVELARRGARVATIAESVGYSDRQLQRRCLDAFGYGAKTLVRILRMNHALDLARRGHPLADTAVRAGYADQAHLARDTRDLTGQTLRQLVAR
jgi:AraC-like DNA-binding protein